MEPWPDPLPIAEPGETAPCVEQRVLSHISGIRLTDDRRRGPVHLVHPRADECLEGRRHAGGVGLTRRHRPVHSPLLTRRGHDSFDQAVDTLIWQPPPDTPKCAGPTGRGHFGSVRLYGASTTGIGVPC